MISLLAMQLLAVVTCALVLAVPGWAIARLVEIDRFVPPTMLPPVWFTFGFGTWTVAMATTLGLHQPWWVTFTTHAALSTALVTWVRVRQHRRGHAKATWEAVNRWTIGGIAACAILAAAFRTRLAFDSLFHLGMARQLLELPHPAYGTLDRIAGAGINPGYAVPSWQALIATVAGVTRLDPATVLESLAMLAVAVAACSAGALGRAVTGTVSGEVAGVAGYAWLRVFFPRRELEGDGIAYAALPGNLTLDILLPVVLVAVLLLFAADAPARRPLALLAGTATALLVIVHANYAIYLAILGIGMLVWLFAFGRWSERERRGALWAGMSVALPTLAVLAVLLPVLATLDRFGQPMEQRIDYYVIGSGVWKIIRPGHLYDGFGAAGMLAVLALPCAAWRTRGAARALIAGGALAVCAVAFVPPLLHALDSTGSRALGLRLPRPFGTLLIAVIAVVVPGLVEAVRAHVARVRTHRGSVAARGVLALPFIVIAGAAALYGYPHARRDPAQYGWNWPTLVGLAGLLGIAVVLARHRRRRGDVPDDVHAATTASPHMVGIAALAVGVCLLPSGIPSLRRGAWQGRQLVSSVRADDLGCGAGIQHRLARVPAGSIVLADPVTGYLVQAIGPGRLVADFKVWNGSTDDTRTNQRIALLEDAFASDSSVTALRALNELERRFHARWLVVAGGNVVPPLGSGLGDADAIGLRDVLRTGVHGAHLIASGHGLLPANATTDDRSACDLQLWHLDGAADASGA